MRQRYAIEDAEHPIYQRKPTMPAQPYSCETEELESLREQVIALNRERAELRDVLRTILDDEMSDCRKSLADEARALLRQLGEAK